MTCINQHIPIHCFISFSFVSLFQFVVHYLCSFCVAECKDYCYCRFFSQQITYNFFLFGFHLSIKHLTKEALCAFEAGTNSVLGFCLGPYMLELSQLLKGVSISCIGRVWYSVTSNQLLIIRMCSHAAHMSNTKIIYLPTNMARLCTYSLFSSTCFLFIAIIFLVIFILNKEKYGGTFL